LLLVAFPAAQAVIMPNLYLPVVLMLAGLIMRGVAFEFRVKAKPAYRTAWNRVFVGGSLLMPFMQGYMIASVVTGFDRSLAAFGFCILAGLSTIAGYALVGASWLIMKTEGELQKKAVCWARGALRFKAAGITAIIVLAPLISARIYGTCYSPFSVLKFVSVPLAAGLLIIAAELALQKQPQANGRGSWKPFAATVGIFLASFVGVASSLYPYLVPGQLKIVDAASAPEALMVMLIGALIVLPFLIGYTFLAYKVFHGKAGDLRYD
jgi:cytochrome d ubiquinol oxidase subunit II